MCVCVCGYMRSHVNILISVGQSEFPAQIRIEGWGDYQQGAPCGTRHDSVTNKPGKDTHRNVTTAIAHSNAFSKL